MWIFAAINIFSKGTIMAEPLENPPVVTDDPEYAGLDEAIDRQQQEAALAESRKTPQDISEEEAAIAALDNQSREDAQIRYQAAIELDEQDAAVAALDEQSRLEAEERLNE